MCAALTCEALDAGYGGIAVVRGFDLELSAGEIVALLGPNGAGKTTLMLTLAGLLSPVGGSARIGSFPINGASAARISRNGLVLVPDDRSLFMSLTTKQNLGLARRKGGPDEKKVLEIFPQLDARLGQRAGTLSGGEQQMLAIARALMQGPKVLLIDELSMGLAPLIARRLLAVVGDIAERLGTAVLIVEQHVPLALDVADRAVVLVHGNVALRGAAAELRTDQRRLERAYLSG